MYIYMYIMYNTYIYIRGNCLDKQHCFYNYPAIA